MRNISYDNPCQSILVFHLHVAVTDDTEYFTQEKDHLTLHGNLNSRKNIASFAQSAWAIHIPPHTQDRSTYTVFFVANHAGSTPKRTLRLVILNDVIVKPMRDRTFGVHPSGMRSSSKKGLRSATSPPRTESNVVALPAPKYEWNPSSENCPLTDLEWARRAVMKREKSAGVSFLPSVEAAMRSWTSFSAGTDWSGCWFVS